MTSSSQISRDKSKDDVSSRVSERFENALNDKNFRVFQPKNLQISIFKRPKFETREAKRVLKMLSDGTYIPGLIYVPDFITETEQNDLKNFLMENQELFSDESVSQIQHGRR